MRFKSSAVIGRHRVSTIWGVPAPRCSNKLGHLIDQNTATARASALRGFCAQKQTAGITFVKAPMTACGAGVCIGVPTQNCELSREIEEFPASPPYRRGAWSRFCPLSFPCSRSASAAAHRWSLSSSPCDIRLSFSGGSVPAAFGCSLPTVCSRVRLYRVRPQLLDTLELVKPATVIGWHRKGFRIYWRWRSRRSGRSKTNTAIRDLIRQMSSANPLWGAPGIHGELPHYLLITLICAAVLTQR
jgi:hypothetical protein